MAISADSVRTDRATIGLSPATLVAASAAKLSEIHSKLKKEIKPRGFIEGFYVEDLANQTCDILNLRRTKNSILRYEMQPALKAILEHVVVELDYDKSIKNDNLAKRLVAGWHRNQKDQALVEKILADFSLDGSNIEAEAWRRASAQLDVIERQLTSLETRRDKTLKSLADYRDVLAPRLKQKVQRVIEAEEPFETNAPPEANGPEAYSRLS